MSESPRQDVLETTGSVTEAAAVVVAELAHRRQVMASHLVLHSLVTWPLVESGLIGEGSVAVAAIGWVSNLLERTEAVESSAHFQTRNGGLDCDGS